MKNKPLHTRQLINKEKIIVIMRGVPINSITKTTEALMNGGIKFIEITLDQKDEHNYKECIKSLTLIKDKFGDDLCVGAGTVMSIKQVKEVFNAGASYIISPNTDQSVIDKTKELDLISIPGAFTPSEIASAYEYGADFVKLFPANCFGPQYIKTLTAPLSHIPILAVGGVTPRNMSEYLEAGAVGIGIGSSVVNLRAIQDENYDLITNAAKAFTQTI